MKKKFQIVIPMAGFGSRLRPWTWSKPKPLINMAGRTSLDYLLDEFKSLEDVFDLEYIFIISPNGWEIKAFMERNYPDYRTEYIVQEEMKGQSHAVFLAKDLISGPMIMTFSDTIIDSDLSFLKDETADGVAWTQYNEHPQRFGVAITRGDNRVERFIEKPPTDEFKQVIVGFYYFKEGKKLIEAIDEEIRENISLKNEFYIADALNIMIQHGAYFKTAETKLWLDTGVPETVFSSNWYFLAHGNDNGAEARKRPGVTVVDPVFIAADAIVENAVIGPYVSVASGAKISNAVIENSIIAENATIENQVISDSLIGAKVQLIGKKRSYFVGDNSVLDV